MELKKKSKFININTSLQMNAANRYKDPGRYSSLVFQPSCFLGHLQFKKENT